MSGERRRPGQETAPTTNTTARIVPPSTDVLPAMTAAVSGCRGRLRLVLLVACRFCDAMHMHTAAPGFVTGRRKAACGGGRYTVRVGDVAASARPVEADAAALWLAIRNRDADQLRALRGQGRRWSR